MNNYFVGLIKKKVNWTRSKSIFE